MGIDSLAFRTAKNLVDFYAHEDHDGNAIVRHQHAMDLSECEDFLQLAINAFDWLMRADLSFRKAIYRDTKNYDQEVDDALSKLLKHWQSPCEFAERWAADLANRGFHVANLARFRECCRAVAGMLTSDAEFFSSEDLVHLRDAALDEHAQGKTIEYRAS